MQIKFKPLHPAARVPLRGSADAAGYDLTCTSIQRTGDIITCGTGLAVEIPRGFFGGLYARSSVYLTGWEKVGGVCVIDSDYRGEIFVLFRDTKRTSYEAAQIRKFLMESGQPERAEMVRPYEVGDRIAQLIVQPCEALDWQGVEKLSDTVRGAGGYGSTGVR